MVIRVMSSKECLRVLARAKVARLACAHKNQPYVVPVNLAYDEASDCLYGFTTAGQKIEWMRANPQVCVEVDEVAAYDQWVSVIAFGRYEELPETIRDDGAHLRPIERPLNVCEAEPVRSTRGRHRQCGDERERACAVLQTQPMWWEPASTAYEARADRDPAKPYTPIFYRIRIDRVTGHEAARATGDANSSAVSAPPAGRWGWIRTTIMRVFRSGSKEEGSAS